MSEFPYLHLSPSSINKYLTCPLSFLYSKTGAPAVMDPRRADTGTAVHAAIQSVYDPRIKCKECDDTRIIKKRYSDSMAGFEALKEMIAPPGQGWRAEAELTHDLEGVTILGRMDLISDDGRTIIDWKTGARSKKDNLQGRIYQWLSCMTYSLDPKDVHVRLAYLREKKYYTVPYTSHQHVEGIMGGVISGITEGNYKAKKGKQCSMCKYRSVCEAW